MVPSAARVLDLGSGLGSVGAALKQKGCYVAGCDLDEGPFTVSFDKFTKADLDKAIPNFGSDNYDFILCLDVIEHLSNPEEFLDQLREVAAKASAEVILTTANIGFVLMRLSLLGGRFEYGKRGILDLTHTRLFTFATIKRAMRAAGFVVTASEGIVLPLPFIFGDNAFSRLLLKINGTLVKLLPALFGFQILVRAKAKPSLSTLLDRAQRAALEKITKESTQSKEYAA